MLISVLSWVIAVLLAVFVALVAALAYVGRHEGSCDPTCFDVRFAIGIVAFGLFGAAVSASISQFSKPRTPGTRRLTKVGVAIYLLPGVASMALFIFIPSGIMMVVMLAAREAW
ncbi:MAG: hypothetical protein J4N79_09635 [Chloroflexi bacterium]|nr:hypothetical protein [Chloroflexota bacterium]